MGWIYVINLLFLILSGTFSFGNSISTILQLNSYKKESYSTCHSGFLNGVDRYIYNGTLNTTSQVLSRRQLVYFQMQKSSLDGYTTVCKVTIYPSCANNQPLDECYCKNTSSSLVELFLNKTANIDYSNGSLQINWPNIDAPKDDFSNVEQIPIIYTNHIENLKVGNVPVILDKCDFQLTATLMIEWCVTGLTSYGLTLNISSNYLQSENKCINYTYNSSSAESTNINFRVSYLEHDGCKRNGSTVCNSNNAPETTIVITTLNTTHVNCTVPSRTTSLTTNYEPLQENKTISAGLTGVLSAHVTCTFTIIILSIIVLVVLLATVKKQLHVRSKPKHIDLLCVLICFFEIAQTIFVIIAGVKFSDEGDTTIDFWKIMIIYQVLVNITFIIIESIVIGIKKYSNGIQVTSHDFLYFITLICIHSVIGILAVPLVWYCLGTQHSSNTTGQHSSNTTDVSLQSKENRSSDGKNVSDHNKRKRETQTDESSNYGINAHITIREYTQEESGHSGQRSAYKDSKKRKKDNKERKTHVKKNDQTSTASQNELKLDNSNALDFQKDKDTSISTKRPVSIEVTNHSDLGNPRKLPPLRKIT